MPTLTIKSDESGIGLFKDDEPWRYFGNIPTSEVRGRMLDLILAVVNEGFDKAQFLGWLPSSVSFPE